MNIGKILKEFRCQSDLNQQDVADALNICRSSYSKIEQNKVMLRVDQMFILADLFGLDVEYFTQRIYDAEFSSIL